MRGGVAVFLRIAPRERVCAGGGDGNGDLSGAIVVPHVARRERPSLGSFPLGPHNGHFCELDRGGVLKDHGLGWGRDRGRARLEHSAVSVRNACAD